MYTEISTDSTDVVTFENTSTEEEDVKTLAMSYLMYKIGKYWASWAEPSRQYEMSLFRAPPMPARRYMEENGSGTMIGLAAKRSAGDAPKVNL